MFWHPLQGSVAENEIIGLIGCPAGDITGYPLVFRIRIFRGGDHVGRMVQPGCRGIRPAVDQSRCAISGTTPQVDDAPRLSERDALDQIFGGTRSFVGKLKILAGVPTWHDVEFNE